MQMMSGGDADEYKAISEAFVDGLVTIDFSGVILSVNSNCEAMFGSSAAFLIGKNVSVLVPPPHDKNHDVYIQTFLKTRIPKVIGRGRELKARRLDTGETFHIHLTVVELVGRSRFLGFVRDISAAKKLQEELDLKHQEFQAVFEGSIDALVTVKLDGSIANVNSTACSLFGYTREELIGANVSILTPPEHREKHQSYIENYLRTGIKKVLGSSRELQGWKKDGSSFAMELSLSEILTENSHWFLGSVRDLTKRKESEANRALLMNMIPSSIARQLSASPGQHIAESFENASILFADIVGFTAMTESLEAMTVVRFLNKIFSDFDHIAEELGVEKIKTIGDCYMAITGAPVPSEGNHAEIMIRFALRMLDSLKTFNARAHVQQGEPVFGLRIGINSGPIIAGVIGTKKFLFDVWSSAVNCASRMESTGIDQLIHCSDIVHELCKHVPDFRFTLRGRVFCKGIGFVTTYFVEDAREVTQIKPEHLVRDMINEQKSY